MQRAIIFAWFQIGFVSSDRSSVQYSGQEEWICHEDDDEDEQDEDEDNLDDEDDDIDEDDKDENKNEDEQGE